MDTYSKIDTELKKMNKTRADLCNETGLSYNTIASLFKRKSENISLEVLRVVAKYLGVSLDYLIYDDIKDSSFGIKKDPAPKHGVKEKKLTPIEKVLLLAGPCGVYEYCSEVVPITKPASPSAMAILSTSIGVARFGLKAQGNE